MKPHAAYLPAVLICICCCLCMPPAKAQQYTTVLDTTFKFAFKTYLSDTNYNMGELTLYRDDLDKHPAAGTIKTIYLKFFNTPDVVYHHFKISIGQAWLGKPSPDDTVSQRQVVFSRDSLVLHQAPAAQTWYPITLDTPVFYDPAKMLIVRFEHGAFSGIPAVLMSEPIKNVRRYGAIGYYTGAVYATVANFQFGFDVSPSARNNSGISLIAEPLYICGSMVKTVNATIRNNGINDITSLKIGWIFRDTVRPVVTFKGLLKPGHDTTIVLGHEYFVAEGTYSCTCWTYNPNDTAERYTADDTMQISLELKRDRYGPTVSVQGANPDVVQVSTPGAPQYYNDAGALLTDLVTQPKDMWVSKMFDFKMDTLGRYGVPDTLGDHLLWYLGTDWCGNANLASRTVKVKDMIPPVISLLGPKLIVICHNQPYTDTGYSVYDNYYKNSDIAIEQIGTFLPKQSASAPGKYWLRYKATDKSGNTALTEARDIVILPDNDPQCSSGINSYGPAPRLTIYPNPTTGSFTILAPATAEAQITLCDQTGRQVYTTTAYFSPNGQTTLHPQNLPPGLYHLTLTTPTQTATGTIAIMQ